MKTRLFNAKLLLQILKGTRLARLRREHQAQRRGWIWYRDGWVPLPIHLLLRVGVHFGPALRLDLPAILQSTFRRLLHGPKKLRSPYSTTSELPTSIQYHDLRPVNG